MNATREYISTPPAWVGWVTRAAGAGLFVSPFLPPIFDRTGHPLLAAAFDAPWVSACHRMPERSLWLFGYVMPLCSRCLGLVTGLGAGMVIAWPLLSIRALRITLSIACALLFVELTTQDLGWHPVFHPTRLLSGFLVAFPIGAAAGALAMGKPQTTRLFAWPLWPTRRPLALPPCAALVSRPLIGSPHSPFARPSTVRRIPHSRALRPFAAFPIRAPFDRSPHSPFARPSTVRRIPHSRTVHPIERRTRKGTTREEQGFCPLPACTAHSCPDGQRGRMNAARGQKPPLYARGASC